MTKPGSTSIETVIKEHDPDVPERRSGKGKMDIFDAVIEMLFYDEMPRRQVKRLYLAARQRMLLGKVRRPK